MNILDATEDDLLPVLGIYNEAVANTTAIWNENQVELEDLRHWLGQKRQQGFPVLVAKLDGDKTVGFASFGDWRAWDGYRHTVELSVYVHKDVRGRGIGTALIRELLNRARSLGKHVVIAGIEASNETSIRMHAGLGFEDAGHLREVGTKFGRWLDLRFMQIVLDDNTDPRGRT
jgi:phosphinothricin acetyltransferase